MITPPSDMRLHVEVDVAMPAGKEHDTRPWLRRRHHQYARGDALPCRPILGHDTHACWQLRFKSKGCDRKGHGRCRKTEQNKGQRCDPHVHLGGLILNRSVIWSSGSESCGVQKL